MGKKASENFKVYYNENGPKISTVSRSVIEEMESILRISTDPGRSRRSTTGGFRHGNVRRRM